LLRSGTIAASTHVGIPCYQRACKGPKHTEAEVRRALSSDVRFMHRQTSIGDAGRSALIRRARAPARQPMAGFGLRRDRCRLRWIGNTWTRAQEQHGEADRLLAPPATCAYQARSDPSRPSLATKKSPLLVFAEHNLKCLVRDEVGSFVRREGGALATAVDRELLLHGCHHLVGINQGPKAACGTGSASRDGGGQSEPLQGVLLAASSSSVRGTHRPDSTVSRLPSEKAVA
jgi:hypothetical protein